MSGAGSNVDERRWNRHKVDLRLRVTTSQLDGASNCFGRAHSLSLGGLGAYIPANLSIGAEVGLALTLPNSNNEVKLKARVCSCDGFRYGLEFVEINQEMQRIIVKTCSTAQGAEAES
jgi:PilZ domain